jgi:hypothetical protein
MHFLSHYYADRQTATPNFTAAVILPDVMGGFTRIYNSVLLKQTPPLGNGVEQVQKGVMRHFEGDKLFHGSKVFEETCHWATLEFVKAGADRSKYRLSVCGHLITEMLLDRHIILNETGIVDEFYEMLNQADNEAFIAWFGHYGLEAEKQKFLAKFQGFRERKFLYYFNDTGKIMYGLTRVYQMATGKEIEEADQPQFLRAVNNIDDRLRYMWADLINTVKTG